MCLAFVTYFLYLKTSDKQRQNKKIKEIKKSHYRPGQALRVPGC
jgi:hypothetical protein